MVYLYNIKRKLEHKLERTVRFMLTLLFPDFSNASINGISGNYETVALLIFKLFFYDTVRT